MVSIKERFNNTLYKLLVPEDQRIIDEYIPKMAAGEINSFMQRLVEHYSNEIVKETLEVKEEPDAILAFEQHHISSRNMAISVKHKIPYSYIVKCFKKHFKKKAYASLAIKEYFIRQYHDDIKTIPSSFDMQYVANFDNYINDQSLQHILYKKYDIGWLPTIDAKHKISEIYVELVGSDNKYIRSIDNIALPIKLYTYRQAASGDKKRLGIALDKKVLMQTVHAEGGYSRNFKTHLNSLKLMDGTDLMPFVKQVGYWTAPNAQKHGFDDRTGVIWFNNNLALSKQHSAIVSLYCLPDSCVKMLQRLDIDKKIKELITALETNKGF